MSVTCLVTGATDGIGLETAHQLAQTGARVLVHGRTEKKAQRACQQLARRTPAATFTPVWADLGRLAEVRALVKQVEAATPTLDVLVNNAGVFALERALSPEGFELTYAVNYFAPFVLTHALLRLLKAAPQGRVVSVSSVAHVKGKVDLSDFAPGKDWNAHATYATSKLMQVLFTHELARRLKNTKVTCYVVHPGIINTKLLRAGFKAPPGDSAVAGARTSVFCATAPELSSHSGRYYANQSETGCAAVADDPQLELALYLKSCALTKVPAIPE